MTSTNHAKLYGLYPRKGTIAVGADADIALWDPDKRVTITNDMLHHGADYTPYEGLDIRGWPVRLLLRGKTIVEDDILSGRPHMETICRANGHRLRGGVLKRLT